MDKEIAINMAVTCVMASMLDNQTKKNVIEVLRSLESNDESKGCDQN